MVLIDKIEGDFKYQNLATPSILGQLLIEKPLPIQNKNSEVAENV